MFQHRSNIEKALSFLKKKSVNDTLKELTCSHHTYRENFTTDTNKIKEMMQFGNR